MLIFSQKDAQTSLLVEEIHPEESYYAPILENLLESEQEELKHIVSLSRRMEWLGARHVLHTISEETDRIPLKKDEFGKPHLAHLLESELHFCSISHSRNLVAAMLSKKPCGCDVQEIVPKISRVASKFLSEKEKEYIASLKDEAFKLQQLCTIWSAKESLYKTYGKKEIDFKKHLLVDFSNPIQARVFLEKDSTKLDLALHIRIFKSSSAVPYVFTWCAE